MIPKSFSATALSTASLCLARYKAESLDRTPGLSNDAASLGTAVHAVLEWFVSTEEPWKREKQSSDLGMMLIRFDIEYDKLLGPDHATDWYTDGKEMIEKWYERTDWTGVEVLSCEQKLNFPITVKQDTEKTAIPFNYIFDRMDKIGDGIYKVVDYKSIRAFVTNDQLRKKIQARAYGVALQIMFPDAKQIWVEFDLLRHSPVGVMFTREDNIANWNYLKVLAQHVADADEEDLPETLNAECNYCIRKVSCKTLASNQLAGGIFSITTTDEAVDKLALVTNQVKALKQLEDDLSEIVLRHAENEDTLEWTSDGRYTVSIGASRRRNVQSERVVSIVGAAIAADYANMTVGLYEKLLKDDRLTTEQLGQLKSAIAIKVGDPSVKITSIGIGEDPE